uniref:cytochrome b/b6 domain-containing protein n=1 Tax=uncultured Draconibacterium sp. TaxID=1573823 RepID=UPI00321696C7
MTASNKIYFYPTWLRIWHAINAIGIILLIVSGISMNSAVKTSFLSFNLAVNLHNISGIVVSLNYLVFLIGNVITKNNKFYIVKPKNFIKRPMKQAYYYTWGMFNGMKAPYPLSEKRKFNPLQKYFYVLIMYVVVLMVIITGFALMFPELIIEKVYNLNGVFITAILHSALGFLISIFLMIHLYVASIGKSPLHNFKSIITGWHHV